MNLAIKIFFSFFVTYSLITIYIVVTRSTNMLINGASDWVALFISVSFGSGIYLIKSKNFYIDSLKSILFIIINAYPSFFYVLYFVCFNYGDCL